MYNASQRILVARELARAGFKVQAALDALHRNYETFRSLSESTIRKMRKDPNFKILLEIQRRNIHEARQATDLEREKARERVEALQNHPVRQMLSAAAREVHDLAKSSPDAKTYKVLLDYLDLMRSMELPEDR